MDRVRTSSLDAPSFRRNSHPVDLLFYSTSLAFFTHVHVPSSCDVDTGSPIRDLPIRTGSSAIRPARATSKLAHLTLTVIFWDLDITFPRKIILIKRSRRHACIMREMFTNFKCQVV